MKRTQLHHTLSVAIGLLLLVMSLSSSSAEMASKQKPAALGSYHSKALSDAQTESIVEVLTGDNNYFLKVDLDDPRVHPIVLLANDDRGGYETLSRIKNRLSGKGYAHWAIVNGDLFSLPSGNPQQDCHTGINCAQGLTYIDGQHIPNWSVYGNTWPARGNIGFDRSNNVQIRRGGDQSKRYMTIAGGPRIVMGGGSPTCEFRQTEHGKYLFPASEEQFDQVYSSATEHWCNSTRAITMVGYSAKGRYLYVGISKGGKTVTQLAQWLKDRGAREILRLDSGSSTGMYHNGQFIGGTKSKLIPNAFAIAVDSGPPPPPPCPSSGGVILYQHAGYDCGGEGEDSGYVRRDSTGWQNVPGSFDNRASSIKIPAGWSVKLYEHRDRDGGWACRNGEDGNFQGDKFNNGVNLNDHVSSFEVFDSSDCGQRSPNTPAPQSPDDGHVTQDGRAPTLCWNNPGDPDGDQLEFYAEVYDSPVNANSGWISDTCWRPHQLDGQYYGYQWHVKARDIPHHAESNWSTAWHFSIEPPPNDPPSISFDTANGDGFPSGGIDSDERNWTFRGTASDPEDQLQAVQFRCNGDNCGTQAGHTNGNNWSHTQNGMAGKNDVYFVAKDDKHSTASRHLDLRIDLAPPGTTLSLNNEANPNRWPAWFRGPVQVRLKASDHSTGRARSGVKEIHYRLDGGAWQTRAGDTVAFTVSSDGTHTVDYYAVDNMGNQEGSRSVTFKIDQTPPSPPSGINETDCNAISNQWQTCNTPRFTWAASGDATSGLAYYEFYFGANPNGAAVHQRFNADANRIWTPRPGGVRTGDYYLRGRTRDNAGNRSAWTNLFTFRYDGTPPENPKEAVHAQGIANDTWQRITNVADFTWPAPYDEGSGIKGYYVFWGTDSNGTSTTFTTNTQYQTPNPLCGANEACTGYLRLRSVDNVDNPAEDWSTAFVLRYDNVPPTVDFTFHGGITRTTQTLVTLDIAASDEGSGVRAMRLSNDGKSWTPWEVPAAQRLWTIPAISRRAWPVYLQVQDGVDLVSDVISHTIYLDVNPQQPRSASFRLFDHALSAGAGEHTSAPSGYEGHSTVGQVVDAAQINSLNYLIMGGYQAGSQALPITEPGHDEFTFINGIFASGTGADTLRSPLFQMLGTVGEVGLPNNETTLTSQNHQFQPGFLAAAPPATPAPTPEPGPTPTPEPTPACEFPQISIDAGAPFTNSAEVTLSICAPRAAEMMLSNDGGFGDAQWEPYTESKPWTLTTYGQYVVPRFVYAAFKDTDGTVHGVYFDDIIHDPNPPSGEILVEDNVPVGQVLGALAAGNQAEESADVLDMGGVRYVKRLGEQVLEQPLALLAAQPGGTVDLFLNAQDDNSGLAKMQLSIGSDFSESDWEPYTALRPWVPEGGDGIKTVYARFQDSAGNVSSSADVTFVLDTLPPVGKLTIGPPVVGPETISATLHLSAWDNLTTATDMRISEDPGFRNAVWRPYTTTLTWPISLTVQSREVLYAQYRDQAGNISEVYSDTYQVDTTPPVLYVEVAPGDTLTRTVTVVAYDELVEVTTMHLSNDPLMIEGVVTLLHTETIEWTFDGQRVVWVQVEDSVGNVSEPFPAYAAPPISCDLAEDGDVITAADVQAIADRWRDTLGDPYDRDGDGKVTVKDIMWFVARWGDSCQ